MQDKININCDGGSRGNPGPAAIGIVLWDENHKRIGQYREYIGQSTNNVAEYRSLIKALDLAASHTRGEVHVFMDSELVIRQVKGIYRVKARHLQPLLQKVKSNEKRFTKVIYNSVRRGNSYQVHADALVNQALDMR
jgi:ribonuclease HI